MNEKWAQWIHASIANYCKPFATGLSVAYLAEELQDRSSDFQESPDRAELRINGPFVTQTGPDQWYATVRINVLVSSHMEGEAKNAYRLDRILGEYQKALGEAIPVFKYGPDAEDDGTPIGCLDFLDEVKVFHFGVVHATDRVREGAVTAGYFIELTD